MNVLIVGAGLFGCSIGEELAKHGIDVTIIDREKEFMQRASKCNHNRMHLGFHYPRSSRTAVQSTNGLLSFMMAYGDAVVNGFPNYYAVAKENSKVEADRFRDFCDEVGLFYVEEMPDKAYINHDFISTSFKCNEPIFDFALLQGIVRKKVNKYSNIKLNFETPFSPSMIDDYDYIVNASYEGINVIHEYLGVEPISLKLQDVVIPILELDIPRIGLTIMDGPFGSVMPKGVDKGKFLLYDVVESVLEQSYDGTLKEDVKVDYDRFIDKAREMYPFCLLYTSPSPRDATLSRMPSSA